MLDAAELTLPLACQLGALQQFFVDRVDQADTRRGGYQMLPLTTDIIALEQCLDDVRTRGGSADAILFHQLAQCLVVHETTSRLHGPEQRGFGVGLWRGGLFLYERWPMRPALTLSEGWQHGLFRRFLLRGLLFLLLAALPLEDGAPSWLQDLPTGGPEINLGRHARDGRC